MRDFHDRAKEFWDEVRVASLVDASGLQPRWRFHPSPKHGVAGNGAVDLLSGPPTRALVVHHLLQELGKSVSGRLTISEIGVADAHTSTVLLAYNPSLYMYLVDIGLRKDAEERLRDYHGRFAFWEQPRVEAAASVQDNVLDLVFIDGLHTYKGVWDDIREWMPKVRAGGILVGHDYYVPSVARAVNEFALSYGLELTLDSEMWWATKGGVKMG